MDKSIRIINDVHDIVKRIKAIDSGYYVIYNLTKRRYEVHHRRNHPNTLAVILPYYKLDARAVNYVRETMIERLNIIASEIEATNQRLDIQSERRILSDAEYKARNLVKYIMRGGNELPSYDDL